MTEGIRIAYTVTNINHIDTQWNFDAQFEGIASVGDKYKVAIVYYQNEQQFKKINPIIEQFMEQFNDNDN